MLLALDTSGPVCSAALHDGERIIAARSDDIGRGHAEHLMPMLEEILASTNADWNDITRIACTTGPGSFTGLRVGLATARGLALGLDRPCIGITVFDAFGHGEEEPLGVLIDAKRDQIWLKLFGPFEAELLCPMALSAGEVAEKLPAEITRLTGSAAPAIASTDSKYEVVSDAPSPPIVGVVGKALLSDSAPVKPKPLYLRLPDAKKQNSAVIRP